MADKYKIRRESALPLYYQIESDLRQRIVLGELEPEKSLPGEESLAEHYGVSRLTVRQALALLARDGLVVRIKGKGTYVSKNLSTVIPPKLTGSIEDLITEVLQTRLKTLTYGIADASGNLLEKLGLDNNDQVYKVEKIRLIKGKPFTYVINYLSTEIGYKIEPFLHLEKQIIRILEDDLNILTMDAVQTIEATSCDAAIAGLLNIRVGDPLLKVETTLFDTDQTPIVHVVNYFRSDMYSYTVRLKR